MAVYAEDENIDPVGACVGPRGTRVQNIVDELNGEKIDIISWSEDPVELISNVLSPATVEEVIVEDYEEQIATIVVPDYQLSLAIGKQGQNVRLAAKVSGWKIDIKSNSQYYSENEEDEIIDTEEIAADEESREDIQVENDCKDSDTQEEINMAEASDSEDTMEGDESVEQTQE